MISLIAAMGKNREIGFQNQLLWKIPEDLRNFKEITSGGTVVMGRKTFESLGRPLPLRRNIVISRSKPLNCSVEIADSIESCLALTQGVKEVFVIGGQQIFEAFLPLSKKMYLSFVDYTGIADTFFPKVSLEAWKKEKGFYREAKENIPAWEFGVFSR